MLTIHPWAWLFNIFSPLVVLIQDLVYGTALRVLVCINRIGGTWRKEEKGAFTVQHSQSEIQVRPVGVSIKKLVRCFTGIVRDLLDILKYTSDISEILKMWFESKWKWDSSGVLMKTDSGSELPDKDTGHMTQEREPPSRHLWDKENAERSMQPLSIRLSRDPGWGNTAAEQEVACQDDQLWFQLCMMIWRIKSTLKSPRPSLLHQSVYQQGYVVWIPLTLS